MIEAVWAAFAAHVPERPDQPRPLSCHRPRMSDYECFEAMLFRFVAGRIAKGSETTLRRRRDERMVTGVFELLATESALKL